MDPFGLGLRPGEPKAAVHRRLLQVPFAVATSLLVVVSGLTGSSPRQSPTLRAVGYGPAPPSS